MVFRNLSIFSGEEQWRPRKFHWVISWVDLRFPSCCSDLYLYELKPEIIKCDMTGLTFRQISISAIPFGMGGLHMESPLCQLLNSVCSSTDHTDGGPAQNPESRSGAGFETRRISVLRILLGAISTSLSTVSL